MHALVWVQARPKLWRRLAIVASLFVLLMATERTCDPTIP